MTMNSTPTRVPTHDKATRRRAAATVAKAYIGHPLFWVVLIVFAAFSVWPAILAVEVHRGELGLAWFIFYAVLALAILVFGLIYVPLAMGLSIYLARDLYYLDTGTARAAVASKPDKRRNALPGDVQAHSFGSWPKKQNAGKALGEWVRHDVHARGGRVTATALPGLAKTYKKYGMVDDGRTAGFLVRVASRPRP